MGRGRGKAGRCRPQETELKEGICRGRGPIVEIGTACYPSPAEVNEKYSPSSGSGGDGEGRMYTKIYGRLLTLVDAT